MPNIIFYFTAFTITPPVHFRNDRHTSSIILPPVFVFGHTATQSRHTLDTPGGPPPSPATAPAGPYRWSRLFVHSNPSICSTSSQPHAIQTLLLIVAPPACATRPPSSSRPITPSLLLLLLLRPHAAMANFQEVGVAFTRHYYTQFDTNRANLRSLYVS